MSSSPAFVAASPSPFRAFRGRFARGFAVLLVTSVMSASLLAQDAVPPEGAPNAGGGRRGGRGQGGFGGQDGGGFGGRGGNFNQEEMQQRIQTALREQFGVTDDAEWKVIYQRIEAIQELQRTTQTAGRGGMAGAAALAGFGGGGRGGRGGGRGGDPAVAALTQAVQDKLPDAEIKARLAALRESRKAAEDRVTKAQEDLRALLDVRQEAVAVIAGLLP